MAYRGKQDVDILVSKDNIAQRKHLFDTYIERMFERPRLNNMSFKKQDTLRWLSWLAVKMIKHNQIQYWLGSMQSHWFDTKRQEQQNKLVSSLFIGLFYSPIVLIPSLFVLTYGEKQIINIVFLFLFLFIGWNSGGIILYLLYGDLIQDYAVRLILAHNNLLPWRLVPFLDHCVDLIFLRRVGGGYIFVHRLLMEHFAEMYVELPTSKGNQK